MVDPPEVSPPMWMIQLDHCDIHELFDLNPKLSIIHQLYVNLKLYKYNILILSPKVATQKIWKYF